MSLRMEACPQMLTYFCVRSALGQVLPVRGTSATHSQNFPPLTNLTRNGKLSRLSLRDLMGARIISVIIVNLSCCVGLALCARQLRSHSVRVRLVARPNYVSVKLPITFALQPFTRAGKLTAAIALGKNNPPDCFCSASPYVLQFRLKLLPVCGCRLVGKSKPHCLSQKNNFPNCFSCAVYTAVANWLQAPTFSEPLAILFMCLRHIK